MYRLREQQFSSGTEDYLEWYRLDNAATIYSLITSTRIPCLFRISATLNSPINVKKLQKALDDIMPRFPYYQVNLRPGLFWYYWEKNPGRPKIIADAKYPCRKMPVRTKGIFPFRVRAYQNRIAVEFHHSLTDGTGALTFLKSLIGEYLTLKGIQVNDWQDIFRPNGNPDLEEYEDGYKKYYQETVPEPQKKRNAFQLPFKLGKKGIYHITTGIVPVKEILKQSREREISLTELLVAIYIDALQEIFFSMPIRMQKRRGNPIRVAVPVNLRRIFPSKTMRNFSLYVSPEIDPRLGEHSFDEIVKQVYHYMRVGVNDKFIHQQIARNVRGELHPFLKITPLFIKRLVAKRLIYFRNGENLLSGKLSNLGKVTMPEPLNEEIQRFEFVPGKTPKIKTGCSIISYKDSLYITFGRMIKENILERKFFRKLVKLGVPVKIETN
ncbi:MAG: hypothetical protein GF308_10685 [Candidatus Heimdallarchaeota archaeon]|nr:hypothetical protein [Candidatus Heimdallarchaeota archaeon]